MDYGVFLKLDGKTEIKDDDYPSAEEEEVIVDSQDSNNKEDTSGGIALFREKAVYPGFHTYSTIGYMIVFTTFVVTMFDVARQLRKNNRLKRNAYAAVATEMNNHH